MVSYFSRCGQEARHRTGTFDIVTSPQRSHTRAEYAESRSCEEQKRRRHYLSRPLPTDLVLVLEPAWALDRAQVVWNRIQVLALTDAGGDLVQIQLQMHGLCPQVRPRPSPPRPWLPLGQLQQLRVWVQHLTLAWAEQQLRAELMKVQTPEQNAEVAIVLSCVVSVHFRFRRPRSLLPSHVLAREVYS
jgi:hypothetical protein